MMGEYATGSLGTLETRAERPATHDVGCQEASSVENPLQTKTDIISHVAEFVQDNQYLFFASVSKDWRSRWGQRPKVTRAVSADTSVVQLRYSFDCGLQRSQRVSEAAARLGKMDLLLSARARDCGCDETTCAAAAAAGGLRILEFLRAKGCPWGDMTYFHAAERGHLDVLKYALANRCPMRKDNMFLVGATAAGDGHLAILHWLVSEGHVEWNESMTCFAARTGQIGVLEWARKKGFPFDAKTSFNAALCGHKDLLLWLRANGFPLDEKVCSGAAHGGHSELLQWLRDEGCPWNEATCSGAAFRGHLHVLIWAKENRCPWNENACRDAAFGGRLDCLKYLRSAGCPWDESTCDSAADMGHLDVLKYARSEGCPWDHNTTVAAWQNNHLEVFHWAVANGCDITPWVGHDWWW